MNGSAGLSRTSVFLSLLSLLQIYNIHKYRYKRVCGRPPVCDVGWGILSNGEINGKNKFKKTLKKVLTMAGVCGIISKLSPRAGRKRERPRA